MHLGGIQMNGAIGTIIAIACIIACIWRICSINDSSETTYSSHTASSATSGEYLDYVAPGRSPVSQRSYRFQIKKVGGEYRAYILNSPSYLNSSTDGHSTHRHYDGRYYVCWSTPVRNQSDMVNIARQWADCTQKYIEYGTRF